MSKGARLVDIATSPTGAFALVDFAQTSADQSKLLIYPRGPSSAPILIPLEGAFLQPSLKISSDGRFIAWVSGSEPVASVYDVVRARTQRLPQAPAPGSDQWIGDELLVRDYTGRIVVFGRGRGGFAPVHADRGRFDPRGPPRAAVSDQLGESFMRGEVVYPSRAAAEAAGAVVVPPAGSALAPFRAGGELFVFQGAAGGPPTAEGSDAVRLDAPDAPLRLVRVSDRKALDLHRRACLPDSMAASPGGTRFAILQAGALVQIIDARTLTLTGAFELDQPASRIAFLSDGALLAMTPKQVIRIDASGVGR